jgi:hypothetical protein
LQVPERCDRGHDGDRHRCRQQRADPGDPAPSRPTPVAVPATAIAANVVALLSRKSAAERGAANTVGTPARRITRAPSAGPPMPPVGSRTSLRCSAIPRFQLARQPMHRDIVPRGALTKSPDVDLGDVLSVTFRSDAPQGPSPARACRRRRFGSLHVPPRDHGLEPRLCLGESRRIEPVLARLSQVPAKSRKLSLAKFANSRAQRALLGFVEEHHTDAFCPCDRILHEEHQLVRSRPLGLNDHDATLRLV